MVEVSNTLFVLRILKIRANKKVIKKVLNLEKKLNLDKVHTFKKFLEISIN